MQERDTAKLKLSQSIENLLLLTSIDNITVKDIVDHCDVSRQTFYRHFKDKYDLVNWTFYRLFSDIMIKLNKSDTWDQAMLKMLEEIKEKEGFFVNAYNCDHQNSFSEFEIKSVITLYEKLTHKYYLEVMDHQIQFLLEMYCIGIVEMTAKWVRNGMKEAPQVLVSLFKESMPAKIRQYLI